MCMNLWRALYILFDRVTVKNPILVKHITLLFVFLELLITKSRKAPRSRSYLTIPPWEISEGFICDSILKCELVFDMSFSLRFFVNLQTDRHEPFYWSDGSGDALYTAWEANQTEHIVLHGYGTSSFVSISMLTGDWVDQTNGDLELPFACGAFTLILLERLKYW